MKKKKHAFLCVLSIFLFIACGSGIFFVDVTAIELNYTSFQLAVNAKRQLEIEVFPEEAPPQRIMWSSSNSSVVTVSIDGLVEAVSLGTAVITAATESGSYQDECTIIVDSELQRLYVNSNCTAPGLGDTWETADVDLQRAIEYASEKGISEVWVAAGTYTPTSSPHVVIDSDGSIISSLNGNRINHFSLRNNVAVIGGFAGNESSVAERNYLSNEVVLAELSEPVHSSNFVFYHPEAAALNSTAVIDGIVIIGVNSGYSSATGVAYGMYNDSCSPTISNCTFRSNDENLVNHLYSINSTVILENCNFQDTGTLKVVNSKCKFTNTTFSDLWGSGYALIMEDSTIDFKSCEFIDSDASDTSAIISIKNSKTQIEDCYFDGVSMDVTCAGPETTDQSLSIINSIYKNGKPWDSYCKGGALSYLGNNQSIEITGCTFDNNEQLHYSALHLNADSIVVDDCLFSNNKGGSGGALYIQQSEVRGFTVSNSTFLKNDSGGVKTQLYGCQLSTFINCDFNDNTAFNGGAADLSSSDNFKFIDCRFNNNSSTNNGGAIYMVNAWPPYKDNIMFENCSFTGNSAVKNGGAMYYNMQFGGATDCLFDGNAAENGGAIYTTGNSSYAAYGRINRSRIINNQAVNGGGLYLVGEKDLYIVNSLIADNSASNNGGAFYSYDLDSYIINSTITGNTAVNDGGGLYFFDGSKSRIYNTILWGDSASAGDEIFMLNGTQPNTIDMKNSIFFQTKIESDDDQYGVIYKSVIPANPFFDAGYKLNPSSPAINFGNNSLLYASDIYDLAKNDRTNGTVDVGAYEY